MTGGTLVAAPRGAQGPVWPGRWMRIGGLAVLPTLGPVAVGLVAPSGRLAFLVALALLVSGLAAYVVVLRARPEVLIGAFLMWLSIERFVVAALAPGLDSVTLPLLLGYKELFFPLLGLVLAPNVARAWREAPTSVRIVDALAIAFGAIVIIGLLLSPAPLMDRVLYARRLALLPLIYGVVRLMPWRVGSLRMVAWLVLVAAFVVAIFGLLERFVLEDLLWRDWIPAAYYYHLSSLGGISAQGTDFPLVGLPVAFYDFTAGLPERRLVSTFLEATTLASFLAMGAILALGLIRPIAPRLLVGGMVALAGYLTLGKAGWLMMVIGLGYVLAVSAIPRLRHPAWLGSMAVGLIGALVVVSIALEARGSATGALAHFEGLRQGIAAIADAPLGHGLGIGGNFGEGTLGAESTFGVLMTQLGVIGLVAWAAWILALAFATGSVGRHHMPMLGAALAAAVIAFFGTAALTESAGGYLGNWVFAMLPAAYLTVAGSARDDVEPAAA